MSEQFKNDNSSSPQGESDVLTAIKRIQQQLVFLERKIDLLVNQSQEKPFRDRPYSKPSGSYGRPYRPDYRRDDRNQGEGSRERNYNSKEHFEKRDREEHRGFNSHKKEYGNDRENSSGQSGYFKKKYEGKKSGFDPKKKQFFHKRKEQ